ncbi:MAG: M48 family metalloprotease, partial [Armatimonadota bacterium]
MKLRSIFVTICILVLLLGVAAVFADTPPYSEEAEEAAGKEVCAAIEKEYDVWDDEETYKKVAHMVETITPHTQRPDIEYNVKLLDTSEVNAFSVPGGNIYVCRGLVEDAQSDDELAAVIAHEIAHNCTYDAMRQAERNRKFFIGGVSAALLSIFFGASSGEVAGVLQAGNFLRQGVLSKYSKEMEERADKNAISYLTETE